VSFKVLINLLASNSTRAHSGSVATSTVSEVRTHISDVDWLNIIASLDTEGAS
jgi:hypothetical protein